MPALWGLTQDLGSQEQHPGFWGESSQAAPSRGRQRTRVRPSSGAPQLSWSLSECQGWSLSRDLTSRLYPCPSGTREPMAPTRLGSALLEGPLFIFHQSHYFPPVLVLRTPACPSPIAVGPFSNPRCLNTSRFEVACPLTGAQWVWLPVLPVCFLHSQHTALPIPAWGVLVSILTVRGHPEPWPPESQWPSGLLLPCREDKV